MAGGRRRRRLARAAGFVLALIGACALGLWASLPWLHARARSWVEQDLSALIQGRIEVDRVDALHLGGAVVSSARLYDAKNRLVVRAKRVRLSLGLRAILAGQIRVSHAEVEAAEVWLFSDDASGAPSLLDAVSPVSDGTESDTEVRGELTHLVLRKARVRGDALGVSDLATDGLDLDLGLSFETGLVRAFVYQARVKLDAPWPQPMSVRKLSGRIEVDDEVRCVLRGLVESESDSARAILHVTQPADGPLSLDLRAHAQPVHVSTLVALEVPGADALQGTLRGDLRMRGPLSALSWQFQLDTDGGPLEAHGTTPAGATTEWHVRSPGLALQRLVQGVPAIKVDGAFHVSLTPPYRTMSLSLEANHLSLADVGGGPLDTSRTHAAGSFDGERLTFDRIRFQHAGGRYQGTGWVSTEGDFDLDMRAEAVDLQRSPLLRPLGMRGNADAELRAAHQNGNYELRGAVSIRKPQVSGVTGREVELRGAIGGTLYRPRIAMTGSGRGLSLGPLQTERLKVRISGERGRYRVALDATAGEDKRLQASGQVQLTNGGVRIQMGQSKLAVGQTRPWRTSADFFVDDRHVEVYQLNLSKRRQRLSASGRYDYAGTLSLDARMEEFAVQPLLELLEVDAGDLAGVGEGSVSVRGPLNDPEGELQITIRDATFLGLDHLTLLHETRLEGAELSGHTRIVLPDASALDVSLSAQLPKEPESPLSSRVAQADYQIGLRFDDLDIRLGRPWLAYAGWPTPEARLTGRVDVSGPLDAPRIEGSLDVSDFSLRKFEDLQIRSRFQLDSHSMSLDELHVSDRAGPILEVHANADLGLSDFGRAMTRASAERAREDFEVSLVLHERDLQTLPGELFPTLGGTLEATLRAGQRGGERYAEADGRMTLNADAPEATCGQGLEPVLELKLRERPAGTRGELVVTVDGTQLARAELTTAQSFANWLLGESDYALPAVDAEGNFQWTNAEDLPFLCEQVAGPLRGQFAMRDVFSDELRADFSAHSPALQFAPRALEGRYLRTAHTLRTYGTPLKLELRGGMGPVRTAIEADIHGERGGRLKLFGSIPRGWFNDNPFEEPISVLAEIDHFELAPLLLQVPGSWVGSGELDGMLSIVIESGETPPKLEGRLSLRDGTLELSQLGQRLTGARASVRVKGNRILLEDVQALDFDGKLSLSGEIEWLKLNELKSELELRVDRFPVRREGRPLSYLSGRASLRGLTTDTSTQLQMRVHELTVRLPPDLASEVMTLADHPDIIVLGEETEAPEERVPYSFELHAIAPRFTVVRTELRAEMAAEVYATYRDPTLRLRGGAELRAGSFALYGKRFRLEQSRIAFDGETDLDPLVDLHASHKVGSDEIGVLVQGRLSDPQVIFTHSDPDIVDQSEILAELVAGRSNQAAQNGEANRAAASFLAGATAGFLTEEVREEIGGVVPVIAFDQQANHLSSTRIRAGLQLDAIITRRLGPLSSVVRGIYVEGFVSPGADADAQSQGLPSESRGGGLLELRFPRSVLGVFEYRPVNNWRVDVAWQP